ncbi:MAG: ABC transporter substrate-binding protein [Acidobacteriota bacterium]
MSKNYFKSGDTLFDITEKHPETIPVFVSKGFPQIGEEDKREKFGRSVTLKNALFFKKINLETFSELLVDAIEQKREGSLLDPESAIDKNKADTLKIEGLLPCPVRIPLTESLESFIGKYKRENNYEIQYELKAASMGLDWLKDILVREEDEKNLSDLFISAGFDLFFDEKLMGKFKKKGVFSDLTGFKKLNSMFDNNNIDLKDPKGHYSMISVVPAVFLVNKNELNGRKMPESWEDILQPEFEKSVSLPIGDFDLFNAILLNIYKKYGEDAVAQLGKSLLEDLHPSQMVKSDKQKTNRPAITIMPYFFTKMTKGDGPMVAVWPKDGSIISPIFMLSKTEKQEKLKPLVDFFASVEVGEILSHRGLFPSTNPDVDNRIPDENKFMWIGWDYIYSNDIAGLLSKCENIFNSSIKE